MNTDSKTLPIRKPDIHAFQELKLITIFHSITNLEYAICTQKNQVPIKGLFTPPKKS
jgi:hypothetical protein